MEARKELGDTYSGVNSNGAGTNSYPYGQKWTFIIPIDHHREKLAPDRSPE